jgi:hypothetical protein
MKVRSQMVYSFQFFGFFPFGFVKIGIKSIHEIRTALSGMNRQQ